jgi:hypothetical protein
LREGIKHKNYVYWRGIFRRCWGVVVGSGSLEPALRAVLRVNGDALR